MNQNNIIVFDLDGTLLDNHKKISLETKQTLQQLSDKVAGFGVATGRGYQSAAHLLEEISLPLLWVCNNGAFVYDQILTQKIIQRFLPGPLLEEMTATMLAQDMAPIFHGGKEKSADSYMVCLENERNHAYCEHYRLHHDVFSYETFGLPKTVYTLCALDSKIHIEKIRNIIESKYASEVNVTCLNMQREDLWMAEITVKIDKYTAIKNLFSDHWSNCPAIMAFGDDFNDISLIQHADIGIAMKNGIIELQKIAPYHTEQNNHDNGVALFLKQWYRL